MKERYFAKKIGLIGWPTFDLRDPVLASFFPPFNAFQDGRFG